MTDNVKADLKKREKPPTQIAGVTGIDGHGAMGAAPSEVAVDWVKLINLPAFQMFVYDQSRFQDINQITSWTNGRREALGDKALYDLYANWHKNKGLWANETPMAELIKG